MSPGDELEEEIEIMPSAILVCIQGLIIPPKRITYYLVLVLYNHRATDKEDN